MHLVEAVLFLMALVTISNVLSHYIVAVPVSLIQVALGLGAALFFHLTINLATDWFMLLFIAPLLFYDGRHFPRRELWELRGPIMGNAIFLVFATMLVGGYLIHFLIPPLPLPASFALAAILSPTDPIAVQSLAKRVHLPSGVLHLVSGESLINDASGLIGFKYGIAATMTGAFALGHAVRDFFYVALVGALAGLVLIGLINLSRNWLLQQGLNDVILHTILQVLTPFFIYLIVDEFMHASGVIAVVVAGLMSNTQHNRYVAALPELRIVSERTWDLIVYTLNGIIFLILGIELPVAMRDTIADHEVNTWQALEFFADVMDLWLHVAYGSFKRQSSFLAGGVVKRYFGCPRCHYASRCVCCSRSIGKWPAVPRAQPDAVYCCRRCRLELNRGDCGLAAGDALSRTAANPWLHDCRRW